MPSEPAQRGRPIALVLAAVLLLGLPAAVPAAADPPPPPTCATADPKANCPTTNPTCVTPTAGGIKPGKTAPAGQQPTVKPTTGKPATGTSTCPGEQPSGGAGTDWALFGSIAALLLLLLVLLALAVRRSGPGRHTAHVRPHRHDAEPAAARTPTVPAHLPGARRAPRPERLRPATVATDLHPQGYVEVDGGLFRAVWSEPSQPPPGAGDPVDVGRPDSRDGAHDPHVLLAFPADIRRRDHAR
ncbi:hypothetical protein ABZ721_22920 [Streptomyces sp. NPDC006733]|uniref:hypothetical protein n=1 Tax=Streptomyces sp. NPDC006733 TaxID=3155460 RepID=UPI0033E5CF18